MKKFIFFGFLALVGLTGCTGKIEAPVAPVANVSYYEIKDGKEVFKYSKIASINAFGDFEVKHTKPLKYVSSIVNGREFYTETETGLFVSGKVERITEQPDGKKNYAVAINARYSKVDEMQDLQGIQLPSISETGTTQRVVTDGVVALKQPDYVLKVELHY